MLLTLPMGIKVMVEAFLVIFWELAFNSHHKLLISILMLIPQLIGVHRYLLENNQNLQTRKNINRYVPIVSIAIIGIFLYTYMRLTMYFDFGV